MALSAVLGSPPPCAGSCWQVMWYWLPWFVLLCLGQTLQSACPGVQLEGMEKKKCGQRALRKDQRDGNKTFCSPAIVFMQVASGRVCLPRPHPVFFQREISQAELLSIPPWMRRGGQSPRPGRQWGAGLVDGRIVPGSNKGLLTIFIKGLLLFDYCLSIDWSLSE